MSKYHFTDAQLDSMYESLQFDALFTGSEIRKLIEEIRTSRAKMEDNSCGLCLLLGLSLSALNVVGWFALFYFLAR